MDAKNHHIVCIPCPVQGHINPMSKLAKLLLSRGFHITFVHTEFNLARLSNSSPSDSPFLKTLDNFRYETIPDGLPADNPRGAIDLPALCNSVSDPSGEPIKALRSLLLKLLDASDAPPVTCVIADAQMNCTYEVTKELGIKSFLFYTPSACAVLGYVHFDQLVERGLFPLKDESCLTNGFLDTPVDWITGLDKRAKLKHIPSFIKAEENEMLFINYNIVGAKNAIDAGSVILNTFDDLEGQALEGLKTKIPNICTIGPLELFCQQSNVPKTGSSLWKEDSNCLEWLDQRSPKSVLYVNYGSLATLTSEQLVEFAWGLANSKQHFLWVIRHDLVDGDSGILSKEFMEEIKGRGLVSGWCPQEKVLKHPSIAVFLTHCGWNSILESIIEGVPMMCWPFFSDQQTNCFYACNDWENGMEIGEGEVKRESVENVVREMMEGEKGKEIKEKAMKWKKKAEEATRPSGSSYNNFENLIKSIFSGSKNHLV